MIFNPCVLCGARQRKLLHKKSFGNIVQCLYCNLVTAINKKTGHFINSQYDKFYYQKKGLTDEKDWGGYFDYFGTEWKSRAIINNDFACVLGSALNSEGSVLDGSGGGQFLNSCKKLGFKTQGIEASKYASEQTEKNFKIPIVQVTIEQYCLTVKDESKFSLITLLDSIEHLNNPIDDLKSLRNLLLPGGRIFISTPLYGGRLSTSQGKNYFQFKRDHIFYFSQDTLELLLRKTGFRKITILLFTEFAKLSKKPLSQLTINKYTKDREHLFAFASL